MATKRTIVVNLLGGPGVGKSVTAAALFVALKVRGYSVEYVQEFAKTLVWSKQFSRLDNQHYVSTKQYELLKQVNGIVDFIVTDGPLYHGLMYNLINPANTSDKDKTQAWILQCASEFNNVNIFLRPGEDSFAYETDGRIQTEEEARELDVVLQHILKRNKIKFDMFESDVSNAAIDRLIEHIVSLRSLFV